MYTTPLSSVLSKAKDIKHHLYADDTQVHNSFNTSSFKDWMYNKKLKLKSDKTEFLVIGQKCHRKSFNSSFPIDILGNNISPTPTARNLGVIFDSDINFIHQINSIIKSCNYPMREFKSIRKHLDQDTAISVANAIVGSHIDYCNSLLFVVPNTHVKKLQSIQNYLARIVTQTPRYTVG